MPRRNFSIHLAWHFQVSFYLSLVLSLSDQFLLHTVHLYLSQGLFITNYSMPWGLFLSLSLSLSLSFSIFLTVKHRNKRQRSQKAKKKRKNLHPATLIFFEESAFYNHNSIRVSHWWMGNCISFRRVVSWVDDGEWDFLEDEIPEHYPQQSRFQDHVQKQATSTESTDNDDDQKQTAELLPMEATKSTTHEVRIKITKKQLAELLRQAESKGLPVQDVLATLIETRKPRGVTHTIGQCWRPALQSIPEIAE